MCRPRRHPVYKFHSHDFVRSDAPPRRKTKERESFGVYSSLDKKEFCEPGVQKSRGLEKEDLL